jgi:chromosome segregation ATPase
LCLGYIKLQSQKQNLHDIPARIKELTTEIEKLREEYPSPNKSTPKHLTLPLPDTLSLLDQQRAELAKLEAEIAALQSQELPRVQQDLARIEGELQTLGTQKKAAVSRAVEAKDRKENGGVDEVERRGRWVKSGDKLLRDVLDDDES